MRENVFANNQTSSPGYRIAGRSNAVAALVAGTDALGHLVAVRNATTRLWLVTRLRVAMALPTPPTLAQELGFTVFKATAYTASHTGGLAMVAVPDVTSFPATPAADIPAGTELRIADTAALTDGTHAALTQIEGGTSIAVTAAADAEKVPLEWLWQMPGGKAIAVQTNEGIVVPNLVAFVSGTARLWFEMDLVVL